MTRSYSGVGSPNPFALLLLAALSALSPARLQAQTSGVHISNQTRGELPSLRLDVDYTVATLPAAASYADKVIVVTNTNSVDCETADSPGTRMLCVSDGANWIPLSSGAGASYTPGAHDLTTVDPSYPNLLANGLSLAYGSTGTPNTTRQPSILFSRRDDGNWTTGQRGVSYNFLTEGGSGHKEMFTIETRTESATISGDQIGLTSRIVQGGAVTGSHSMFAMWANADCFSALGDCGALEVNVINDSASDAADNYFSGTGSRHYGLAVIGAPGGSASDPTTMIALGVQNTNSPFQMGIEFQQDSVKAGRPAVLLPNNRAIFGRNAADSAFVEMLSVSAADILRFGDDDMTFNGDVLTLGSTATKGLRFGDGDSGFTEPSDDVLDFRVAGNVHTILGGSQTLLVQDQTATTGSTLAIVKAGAGQSSPIFEVQNNAGSTLMSVAANGDFTTGGAGNTITGPAAGMIVTGGTAAGADLYLRTTTNASKGSYFMDELSDGCLQVTSGVVDSTGVACGAGGGGGSSTVTLAEIGRPVGASSNTYSGLYPQGVVSTTAAISSGMYSMTDADTELFYIDAGIIPSNANMADVDIEIGFEGQGTGTDNFEHEVTVSCLAMGGTTRVPLQVTTSGSTDFDELTYAPSDPSSAATIVTAGSATNFGPVYGSLTGIDYTVDASGCGAGDLLAIKVARDGDDAQTGNTNIFWFKMTAAATGGGGGGGRTYLAKFDFGDGTSSAAFTTDAAGEPCLLDSSSIWRGGNDILDDGVALLNRTGAEGVSCKAGIIPSGLDLTDLTWTIYGSESHSTNLQWTVDLLAYCLVTGESIGSFSTTVGTIVVPTGATGGVLFVGESDPTVDISSLCNSSASDPEALYLRVQINSDTNESTEAGDFQLGGFSLYTN